MTDDDLEAKLGLVTEEDIESVAAEQKSSHKKQNIKSNIAILISLSLLGTLGVSKVISMRSDKPDPRLPILAIGEELEYFKKNNGANRRRNEIPNLESYSEIPRISAIAQLGKFKGILGSNLEVKALSSKVDISRPSVIGVGNYVYRENFQTFMHGNGFVVKEGSRLYLPINQGTDKSPTVIHDNYLRSMIRSNTRGHEALKFQTFLYTSGYKEVGKLDSWAGSKTMIGFRNFLKTQGLSSENRISDVSRERINNLAGTYVDTDNCIIMEYDNEQGRYMVSMLVQDGDIYTSGKAYGNITVNSSKGMTVFKDEEEFKFKKFIGSRRTQMVHTNID